MNLEIKKLKKAVKMTSVADLDETALQKLNKGQMSNFVCSLTKLLDENINLCKAVASSLDSMKTKVLDTQTQLIEGQKQEISTVKEVVQVEMKTRADVVKKNSYQDKQSTKKSVKDAIKAEERRRILVKNFHHLWCKR
jgi:hypothetical protein